MLATSLRTPTDVGMRIRVVATYSDGNGGPEESASFTSETPVQAARLDAENSAPEFACYHCYQKDCGEQYGQRRRADHGHGRQ